LFSSAASAGVTIDINFEGDTVGSQPGVNSAPGSIVTQPYSIGGFLDPAPDPETLPNATVGTIVVQNSMASQEALFTTNSTNASLGALWMDVNGFNLVGQQIRMSFDVAVVAAPTIATTQPKSLPSGIAGILLGMNTHTSSDQGSEWAFRFAVVPTMDNGGVFAFRTPDNMGLIPFFDYIEGMRYNVEILADYDTGKLDALVDGDQKLTDYAFWSGGKTNVATNEFFFHLNGETSSSTSVALDNITANAVASTPEPASLAVWSVLGLVSIAAARRKKHIFKA
jgi:hypothetical protein